MKKKLLSLTLALVMCLGLTVPAFADTNVQSVTVVDSTGLSITLNLSNSILGTETLAAGDGDETNVTVYLVPAGTTVTPSIPGASWKEGIFNGDMLCKADFVGTLPAGQTWDGEEGVEFACIKQTEAADSWTDGDYFSGNTTLSDGVLAIVCQHYYSVQDPDSVGTARKSSRVYFRVVGETSTPPDQDEKVENIPASGTAYASTQTVTVDGKAVDFEMYALKDANGNDTNYIKLRDLAYVLNGTAAQFEVGWDGAVNIEPGKPYTAAGSEMSTPYSGDRAYEVSASETRVNGAAAALEAITLKDDAGNGYTYYKLRDLGQALGFNVGWSAQAGVFVETDKPYAG